MAIVRTIHRQTMRFLAILLTVAFVIPVPNADARGLRFIRDAEIEDLLQDYAKPILRVANLGGGRVTMRVINDPSFNAFVLDGRNIFMNTGTLAQAETPNAVIGVIAHEAGHIAGGHLAGLRAKIKRDSTKLLLAQILGIGALIAGGASGDQGTQEAAGGIGKTILGTSGNTLQRTILSYRRVQEAAADQAGVRYLTATGQSAKGMLETFETLAQQEYFSARVQDTYTRSHPVAQTRVAQLRRRAAESPHYNKVDPPSLQLRHDLMRAKLSGYLERPSAVFNRYPKSDTSLPAIYARAIAGFFAGGLNAALPRVEKLIKLRPKNPYFHELKGELLVRGGRSREAIAPLQRALAIRGNQPLIQVRLAQAMIASKNPKHTNAAIKHLRQALVVEKSSLAYRQLATAYWNKKREGDAYLASAQAYFFEGKVNDARRFAQRAQAKFKRGTAQWIQADDIIRYTKKK